MSSIALRQRCLAAVSPDLGLGDVNLHLQRYVSALRKRAKSADFDDDIASRVARHGR
jgi:hypothetical protein